jgi:uncharacterized membrane protein YdjX (TVP38/TMEM64 family)
MSHPRLLSQRKLLLLLGAILVAGGGGIAALAAGLDVRALAGEFMAVVREAGPLVFFTAMALLPAAGFPLMAFCLAAGPAFVPSLGLGGVLLACAAAILANILLTYWLARYALRPLLSAVVRRLGYRIPEVDASDHWDLALLVRITPGPPFFVQSYLLGLAGIPFRIYLLPSFVMPMINTSGVVIFGDAIAHGKAKWAVVGISLVVAGMLAVHLLRRHYRGRRPTRPPAGD